MRMMNYINNCRNAIRSTDENDILKIEELLRCRPDAPDYFDVSCVSDMLSVEVSNISRIRGVHPHFVFNSMLCALSVACGKNVSIMSDTWGKMVYPNIYAVGIGESASGKSPATDDVFEHTIEKRNWKMIDDAESALKDIEMEEGLNSMDIQRKSQKAHMGSTYCAMNNVTEQALIHSLRNGAILYNFDEVKMFKNEWCPNGPGERGDRMTIMTSLQSKRGVASSRIGSSNRSVKNAALSFHACGTVSTAKFFFDPIYLEDGTTYRYLFSITPPKEVLLYENGGIDVRLSRERLKPRVPLEFVRIFDAVFDQFYSSDIPSTFYYDDKAEDLKHVVTRGILDTCSDVYLSAGKSIRRAMVEKIHGFIDKLSLLFHLISEFENPLCTMPNNLVGEKSIDAAFGYMRCMFNNWLDLTSMTEKKTDEEIAEIKDRSTDKIRIPVEYVKAYSIIFRETKMNAADVDSFPLDKLLEPMKKCTYPFIKASKGRFLKMNGTHLQIDESANSVRFLTRIQDEDIDKMMLKIKEKTA